ncbi:medium-chain acyl-CoA ligase ACSF2, mitochondrial [Lucilia cuprina]|uniref:medium-chain acyl-CoA ligase ACSF2, mitochondrial n=1 Tax=Lucilia cuprina TaxID=7375 RepID=UPI001F059EED|nr:medium-chain acyl-CoA ligase ACSF2, mitochondrial [Lucilia cuprina]
MINKRLQIISKHFFEKYAAKLTKKPSYRGLSTVSRTHSATVEANQSYINYMGKHPFVYRNVGQELERAAANYSSTEAIVSCHEARRLTFKSLIGEVDRLAAGFWKLGLKKGDHVGIWGPNNIHWYLTMLAASRAGLVSVGINPAFQGPELEYCLKKVNVKAIVCPLTYKSQNYYEIIHSICPELSNSEKGNIKSANLPHLKAVIINTDSQLKGALTFNEVLDLSDKQGCNDIYKLQPYIIPDTPCNIQFTSGTTGHPKAAVLSHFSFVNNGIHIGNRNQLKGARICVQVPLFHAYGVVISIMAGMSHGATLVLPSPGFSPEHSLKASVEEKCTVIHGTPTMYVDLIKKQRELNLPLTTLKMAVTGGAPCSPQLFLDMKSVLNLQEVRTIFGMTETSASIFQSRPGDTMEQVLNTVGHIQDNIEAKVVDAEGNIVPFGQPGELLVRGYLTMLGYHGDEEKTKETIGADKWLRTGDQFVLQPDGYGRIVGRLKEMIIRGGENIFPKEIEDFLNAHDDILETHVIGVPDERMGEEICAFIRMHDSTSKIDRETVKQYCKGKLAHFKVPRYVITVDDFPKTTSGKIQKFKLIEQFQKTYGK